MKAKHNSVGAKSGEYTGIKLTWIFRFLKIFWVSLLLCDGQLSIVNTVSAKLNIWFSLIHILILFIKWQNTIESIGLFVKSKYPQPFDNTPRIKYNEPEKGVFLVSLFKPFKLQE